MFRSLIKTPVTKIFILVSLFGFFALPLQADDWRLDKDEDGIKVYTRAVQNSAIREIKAELTIETSLDSIMAVFDDIPALPHWNHQCTKALPLTQVSAKERYHYQNIHMPFPVLDRDLLIHSQILQHGDKIIVQLNAAPDYCKQHVVKQCNVIKQSQNIMVNHSKGTYQLTPRGSNKVNVIWTQHTEPAGKIPHWLINSLLIDIPFNTLKKLRKQVTLSKYQQAKLKRDSRGRILGF